MTAMNIPICVIGFFTTVAMKLDVSLCVLPCVQWCIARRSCHEVLRAQAAGVRALRSVWTETEENSVEDANSRYSTNSSEESRLFSVEHVQSAHMSDAHRHGTRIELNVTWLRPSL